VTISALLSLHSTRCEHKIMAEQNNPTPAPADPIAAKTVTEGKDEIDLRSQLEAERTARKKAETDAAYAQDEARKLKEIQGRPAVPPARKKCGWTFFDEPED
jgi:hypothetical protein